jgi:hypothetical protein
MGPVFSGVNPAMVIGFPLIDSIPINAYKVPRSPVRLTGESSGDCRILFHGAFMPGNSI